MSSDKASISLDSLLILFLLGWGFLFLMAIVQSVNLCIRRYRGDDGARVGEEETPERYLTMSSTRQEEIDNLRETALQRHLSKFTLTLGDEHLLCCFGSQTDTTPSLSTKEDKDGSLTSDESCKDLESNNDVEIVNNDVADVRNGGDNMAQEHDHDSKSTGAGVAAIEYTHISIPMPGCEMAALSTNICSTEAAKEGNKHDGKGKRWKLPSLFFQTRNDEENEKSQTQTEADSTTDNKPDSQLQTAEKRNVPISCAICLSGYEKGERVCWSSNAECSHVFHEDCILQWLTSSGKKRSLRQCFTKHPTDAKLLEDEFCPCCRQEFICVKPARALLGSEENV